MVLGSFTDTSGIKRRTWEISHQQSTMWIPPPPPSYDRNHHGISLSLYVWVRSCLWLGPARWVFLWKDSNHWSTQSSGQNTSLCPPNTIQDWNPPYMKFIFRSTDSETQNVFQHHPSIHSSFSFLWSNDDGNEMIQYYTMNSLFPESLKHTPVTIPLVEGNCYNSAEPPEPELCVWFESSFCKL
jgi:hypothetical protein